jgi:hypothetical protein
MGREADSLRASRKARAMAKAKALTQRAQRKDAKDAGKART